jgi:hypothetical protein
MPGDLQIWCLIGSHAQLDVRMKAYARDNVADLAGACSD